MPQPTALTTQRRRSARSVRNDGAILDAAVRLLDAEGWGALNHRRVAAAAGLSVRPVGDRYDDMVGLAAAVWRDRVGPIAVSSVTDLIAAIPEPGGADPDWAAALRGLVEPGPQLRVAAELLVVRAFEPELRAAIDSSFGDLLVTTATPVPGRVTRATAARHAYATILGLGLLLLAARPGPASRDPWPELRRIGSALATRAAPTALPRERARHLDAGAVFDTGEPGLDALLRATLDEVGRRGFDRATTASIARAAGVSEGFIFGRYSSKAELFLDATLREFAHAGELNNEYLARLSASLSPGRSEAVGLREFMRPGREIQRALYLEQSRLCRHNPAVRAVVEDGYASMIEMVRPTYSHLTEPELQGTMHVGLAVGYGSTLLAQLAPDAWRLPYDVVTVPLVDGGP